MFVAGKLLEGLKMFEPPGRELAFTYPDWLEEHMAEMQTPFILLHGTGDKVTDPNTSQKMYEVAAAKDKTIKLLGRFLPSRYLALTSPPLIQKVSCFLVFSSAFFPHIPLSELSTHKTSQAQLL